MRTLADLVLIAFCVLGCLDRDEETHYDRTPAGFTARWVTLRQPDKARLYVEFDAAIVRAEGELLRDHGISPQETRNKATGIRFDLHDHVYFATSGGLAVGAYWPARHPRIELAYWPYEIAPDEATARALAAATWTVYRGTKTGNWYYGVRDPARMYPALAHEIAHALGIHHKPDQPAITLFDD